MYNKFKSLSRVKKFGLGSAAVFTLCVIGAANQPQPPNITVQNSSSKVLGDSTGAPKVESKAPTVITKTETTTQPIPFATTTTNDASLPKGQTKITTAGVDGVATLTYELTYTDGKQTDKKLISTVTTTEPVTQVSAIGTYVAPKPVASNNACDPNYAGACVPIASDVDCSGGGGNGPAYVRGPVRVVGTDIYDLDRDGNGIGCE